MKLIFRSLLVAALALPVISQASSYRVPKQALADMDLERAVDIIVSEKGAEWIQKPKEVCFIMNKGKMQRADDSITLQGLKEFELMDAVSFEDGKMIKQPHLRLLQVKFVVPGYPGATCKVGIAGLTPERVETIASAFQHVANTDKVTVDALLHDLFYVDPNSLSPEELYVATEMTFDEARVMLDEISNAAVSSLASGTLIEASAIPAPGAVIRTKMEIFINGKKLSASESKLDLQSKVGDQWTVVHTTTSEQTMGSTSNKYQTVNTCQIDDITRILLGAPAAPCTSDRGATTSERIIREEGQPIGLPLATDKPIRHLREYVYSTEMANLPNPQEFVMAMYSVCVPELVETVVVPAGEFETIRLRCGMANVSSPGEPTERHIRGMSTTWIDVKTGVSVKTVSPQMNLVLVELSGFEPL